LHLWSNKNAESVRRVLAAGDWTLLQKRDVRNVCREVFLAGNSYVVKRYTHEDRPSLFRRPWIQEDRALHRLRGRGAPLPVGYISETSAGRRRIILVRHFVPGEPVENLDASIIEEIAALMALFHGAGVTTDDAHRHNFIRDLRGNLVFLDFGRARIFSRHSPLLFAGVAVDLHRFYRATLKRDQNLWKIFLDAYFEKSTFGPGSKRLTRCLLAFDMRRYRWVKGPPG
jgi:tRNA A-37 threonylcarbamoyl transferase component Bud32